MGAEAEKLIVVKLGGSAITFKNRPLMARMEVVEMVANDIQRLYEDYDLILVHGGGSFGHPIVSEYGIEEGLKEFKHLLGFSWTSYWMARLNALIVKSIIARGVPSVGIRTSSCIVARDGKIQEFFMRPIMEFLSRRIIPVMYGDVVADVNRGSAVISGDDIAAELALKLRARRLVFGMDVEGVYDRNPKVSKNARPIRRLSARHLSSISTPVAGIDVTGGLGHKLKVAARVAEQGIEVVFGNITVEGGLYKLVCGDRGDFTILLPGK